MQNSPGSAINACTAARMLATMAAAASGSIFLYASRPIALRLLADARELTTSLGGLRVISPEGLIGFKLQGLVNDPRRIWRISEL